MTASCPIGKRLEFNRPGSCNHWWVEVQKNGYEVTPAESVTDDNQNPQATRAPAREGNGETDRPILI